MIKNNFEHHLEDHTLKASYPLRLFLLNQLLSLVCLPCFLQSSLSSVYTVLFYSKNEKSLRRRDFLRCFSSGSQNENSFFTHFLIFSPSSSPPLLLHENRSQRKEKDSRETFLSTKENINFWWREREIVTAENLMLEVEVTKKSQETQEKIFEEYTP